MEKRYILRKVGKCEGCQFQYQLRTDDPCTSCERNTLLIEKIDDKFQKADQSLPEAPEGYEDDTDQLENNKKVLDDWGMGVKKKKKGGLR